MKQDPVLTMSPWGGRQLRVAAWPGFKIQVPKNLDPLMHQYWSDDEERKEMRRTPLCGGDHPQTGCRYGRRDATHHANTLC